MTRRRHGERISNVQRALRVFTTIGVGLLLAVSAAAQGNGEATDSRESRKGYLVPSAAKSVEVADFYLKKKKYSAALSRYKEAVKTDPYYAPGYLGLGRVYEKIGLKQKALEAYRKYLETLPSTKDAEEAKSVHEAIARLESELKTPAPQRAAPPPSL